MAEQSMVPQALEAVTAAVMRREGGHFRSAILFGSHARGDADPNSDVDVAVVLDDRPGDTLDAVMVLSEIAYDVLLETGVLIQPVPVCSEEWEHPERHTNPRLLATRGQAADAIKTHGAVHGAFALEFVKSGLVPREIGRALGQVQDIRLLADYAAAPVPHDKED